MTATLLTLGAESSLDQARVSLEKWVEARQLISKTTADWQADKEMLQQTAQLFERELASIQEQMSKLSTNNTQVEKERAQATELLQASNQSLDWVREQAGTLEAKITSLAPRLPAPLQETLKPILNRFPSDTTKTRLTAAERMQAVVGALNEIDKFNNAVTIFNEKRKNQKGDEVAVDTVYVGLGAAYFVSSTGDLAGTGTPNEKGWEWTIQPALGPSVQEVVKIYRNERSARFVPLPVAIR